MDIMQMGAELLKNKLGSGESTDNIAGALGDLIGGEGGGLDIGGLVAKFTSAGGLQSVVSSWLGDGANDSIDAGKIMEIFGDGKVSEFASKLGIDSGSAADGLSDVIPEMVDKASSGGSLLDSVGGVGGLMGMAKKFF